MTAGETDHPDVPRLSTPGVESRECLATDLRRIAAFRWNQIFDLLTATWRNFLLDKVPRLSASVAFYTLLSLAPLLVVVIAIAGFAFGREAATGQLVWQIEEV